MSTLDFSLIEKAGLTQGEFADLIGVTRVTVNLWVNGGTPSPYLTKVCAARLAKLEAAIDAEYLPAPLLEMHPTQYNREERRETIRAALQRVEDARQTKTA